MKKNSAVTLISLIITIIVLLILAGVTISMILGDNGILTKATEAKINSEIADIKERAEMVKLEMLMDAQNNGTTLKRGELVDGINNEFEGLKEGYSSIVEDGKYVVNYIDQNNGKREIWNTEITENTVNSSVPIIIY